MQTVPSMTELMRKWETADVRIRSWWDADLRRAQEPELRDPAKNAIWFVDEDHRSRESRPGEEATLLFLPYPYISAGGSEAAFPEMYCWDIYFINKALLIHERREIVRHHIANHLSMIERFGMVLNGNRTYYLTRSQTPLLAQAIREYCHPDPDRDMLMMAYPLLRREFEKYWCAPHHATPNGLATNRDLGDPHLRPELAAEAESYDFTACYAGDVRKCNPLTLNCALVRYAKDLAWIAGELGWADQESVWTLLAEERAKKIRELMWDPAEGFFFEYQHERGVRLPFWSVAAYWTLWAGIATKRQGESLVRNLSRFEHAWGLTHTDVAYPSPHPEFDWVQWGYPSGWPPMHMMVVEGLDAYGYHADAERIAGKYLSMLLGEFERTGAFWEKYNVVEGTSELPRERTPNVPLHGWTTAAAVWLGHRLRNAFSRDRGGEQ
jgi:alpha,alpha-trehalase